MNDPQDNPIYNMKVVVRETGLKPDTLRAWERRYGVPNPDRTSGGHRLYSQYQIDMLKWMIARQGEGMSISHAIDLWQQLISHGEDPFLMDGEMANSPPGSTYELSGDALTDLRTAWLDACLNFDEHNANQILAQAFAQFPGETVCYELLQKNLSRIGQMWYEGSATVQQEHFCSSMAIRQLESLLASVPRPTYDVKILVGCGPLEQHTFGALFLTYLCRRRGWDVVCLGANVPKSRLETAVQTVEPNLLVLTAQTLHAAGALMEAAQLLYEHHVPFGYGGAVFGYLQNARRHIPGYYLGDDLLEAPDRIAQLLSDKKGMVEAEPVPERYPAAVSHFCRYRSAIELFVENELAEDALTARQIQKTNADMGDNIVAALQLGDINLLTANINWLKGLLLHYHDVMPQNDMDPYIDAYNRGAEQILDPINGKIILDWFAQLR